MSSKNKMVFVFSAIFLLLFVALTASMSFVDVQQIGPLNSSVGYATINGAVDAMVLRIDVFGIISDIIKFMCYGLVGVFALTGLVQLIKRKKLFDVDGDILLLGCLYIAVFGAYFLFEKFAIQCRPILVDGKLEASYPSSHTYVIIVVLLTFCMFISKREAYTRLIRAIIYIVSAFLSVFICAARLLAKAHWFTDIVGSVLLACFLVTLYYGFLTLYYDKKSSSTKKYRGASHLQ